MTQHQQHRRLELSPAQVAGSALAAMSGAFFASWAGTAGTLIGAAAGSIIATVGATTYTWWLRRTGDAVKRTAVQVRPGVSTTTALRSTTADPGTEPSPGAAVRRWDLPWGRLAVASLVVMVVGMAGITVLETVTGRSLGSYTGRESAPGTTIGTVLGTQGTDHPDRATRRPGSSLEGGKGSTDQQPGSGDSSPTKTPRPGSPATATPSTDPAPDPSPSVDPTPAPDPTPDPGPADPTP